MTRLTEIMTPAVKAVSADSTLKELAEFFIEEDVSGAPVVAGGRLVGVVSVTDLVEFDADARGEPAYESVAASTEITADDWSAVEPSPTYYSDPWDEDRVSVKSRLGTSGPLWNSLEEHTVEDVMTRQLLTLPSHADAKEAAGAMVGAGVHRILVMEGESLAGVVTMTDIVRAVAVRGLGS